MNDGVDLRRLHVCGWSIITARSRPPPTRCI